MRLFVLSLVSLVGLTGIGAAQTSLFDQPLSPATPPAALPPGGSIAPVPARQPAAITPAAPRRAAPVAQPAPAPATAQSEPASPDAVAAKPKPKPKPKPRGTVPARALSIVNDSTGTLAELTVSAGAENVSLGKPLEPGEKVELKLPKLKECNVTVTATFAKVATPDASDYDICKGKVVHFTD